MSSSIKKFYKEHPDTLCGKNNPMYGRKRMHLISDPSIWLMVKPEQFEEYIKMGYAFNDKNFRFEVET